MDYVAYLLKDGRSDFGVSFPDFPSCITAGRTLEEARLMAAEALVSVEAPEKTARINITARESQIEEIDRLASQAGLTRSAFLVRSALSGVKSDAKRRVSAF